MSSRWVCDMKVGVCRFSFFVAFNRAYMYAIVEEACMTESLSALESKRSQIQREISALGDMRAGSITTTGGRCGNPNCHCRRDGDPGHGPFCRLTRKVGGKTITETF